ncbi:4Fe-4S dicluster domain-containing protein [Gemmatimonadota bacterium]
MWITNLSVVGGVSASVGAVLFVVLLVAAAASARENEPVAAARLFAGALVLPALFVGAGFASATTGNTPALLLLSLSGAAIGLLLVPLGGNTKITDDLPSGRIDERDIMFSRAALEPGSIRFQEYYQDRPQNRAPDDNFRSKPGLLNEGATAYDPFHFSAADASFVTIEQLRPFVDGAPALNRTNPEPQAMTEFIKRWGQKLGAVSVGIAELRDYHLYSVVGRGDEYGQPVELGHKFGIALTVEMNKRTLDSAPLGPAVMESAQQYVASGVIAVQMATFIRKLGYTARAHIDGNYRVVCPLVARDAGLGEIGRMGLLMTPKLGPRVRLAVVTTDLPLVSNRRIFDSTTIDFCERCKKCATVCPSGAISSERRSLVDGVKRWQIDSEACFTLWCQLGTDCARCVKVCPYSHPDNMLHNLVRLGVRHSSLVRELAVRMDDLLYGRSPRPSDLLDWQKVNTRGG